jgi:phage FluMu protein Com
MKLKHKGAMMEKEQTYLSELKKIRCIYCKKVLEEALYGEIRKKCPYCGRYNHLVVTSKGIIDLNHVKMKVTGK